jgi:uncharacterized membrane protein YdcZ (DUF606 family)
MPSGAIPTVLRTAGTFSPSARHKRSFCAAFFKKRPLPLSELSRGAAVSRTTLPAWSGGLFGSIFIITAILTVPRLGAATVLALVVVGQMIGSLTFDQFGLLGLPQQPATVVRLAGAGLLIAGVVLVRT